MAYSTAEDIRRDVIAQETKLGLIARHYDRLINEIILTPLTDWMRHLPMPGERTSEEMWGHGRLPYACWNGREYDDGGGAVIAAIRYQRVT